MKLMRRKSLKVGKLYWSDCYLIMFENTNVDYVNADPNYTIDISDIGRQPGDAPIEPEELELAIAYWSKRLKQRILYTEPNIPFMVLAHQKIGSLDFYNVLHAGRTGWIVWNDWVHFAKYER